MGSVLDLFGVLDANLQPDADWTAPEADAQALYDDFRAVAGDMWAAVSQYDLEDTYDTGAAPDG